MMVNLKKTDRISAEGTLIISGSKSETNRLLILQALHPNLRLQNMSNSDDSRVLQDALRKTSTPGDYTIHIGHAGTAMRFLTAYFASQEGLEVTLSGSERMHKRPIGILVEALRDLGADISYLEHEGYPPLRIRGKNLEGFQVSVNANVSSQFITALLLIAPSLPCGMEITLVGKLTSKSYLEMTLRQFQLLNIDYSWEGDTIRVFPKDLENTVTQGIESDWSSLSYYYSLLALMPEGQLEFQYFSQDSLQGDAVLQEIYQNLGVETNFDDQKQSVILKRVPHHLSDGVFLDLNQTPDIAQTIAVTCFGLGIGCRLTGLHTLKIKETDRLQALKNELEKLGAEVRITNDSLHLEPSEVILEGKTMETYDDHRMAMAFAPLIAKTTLRIKDAHVVSKSYTEFWEHLQKIGLDVEIFTKQG